MFLGDKQICFVLQLLLATTQGQYFAIVYEYVTYHARVLINIIMCMQGRRSLAFDNSWLKAPSPYMLLSEDMQHIYYHYGIIHYTPIINLHV